MRHACMPRFRRLLRVLGCVLAAWTLHGASAPAGKPLLAFRVEARVALNLTELNFSAVRVLSDGGLLFLSADRQSIQRLAHPAGPANSFNIHSVPQVARASVRCGPDVGFDDARRVYVPAVWAHRDGGGSAKAQAGVFIFDADGRHVATVELPVRTAPERILVHPSGDLIVLGLDADYFNGRKPDCFLLHRVNLQGQLVRSFSPCPLPMEGLPGAGALRVPTADLREEVGRKADLWMTGRDLFHLLPVSRRLRIFESEGELKREVVFSLPERSELLARFGLRSQPAQTQVSKVVCLPTGTFLVEWLHIERVAAWRERRLTYLALHDSDGVPVTAASDPPASPSVPIGADAQGRVLFLWLNRSPAPRVELLLARAVVE